MTNEEKVTTIVGRAKVMLPMMRSQLGDSVTGYAEYFKKSLLNMAEWKDQQFEEILKEECNTSYESGMSEGERKAEVRFKEYLEKMQKEFTDDEAGYYVINRIINELFNAD